MESQMKLRFGTVAVYTLAAVMYFLPIPVPHKLALPMLLLTVLSFGQVPHIMTLAFLFSCLGDLAGSYHTGDNVIPFLLQMGGFAVAHVLMTTNFLKAGSGRGRKVWYVAAAAAVAISAMLLIVPDTPTGAVRIGTIVYILVISLMLASALKTERLLTSAGAVLFVASDYTLAWSSFVGSIPGSGYLILVPYYLAQILIFCGETR